MSTTFGVRVPSRFDEGEEIVEVAFRSGGIRWKNPLGPLLEDSVEVIPLDNSAQGIFTIGDIRREIEKQENK